MAHSKVSVIIPSYNSARYLPQAIESGLAQTYTDNEIIVVDDGSEDDTKQVVATYYNRVQYICQLNQGVGSARNTGIRYARGEYFVFLDADDLLLPDKLRLQAAFLDENPNIDIVYSDGYRFRVNVNGAEERQLFSACGMLNKSLGAPSESVPILAIQNAFPIHAAMVRQSCVREVGGFDEGESLMSIEDWDLWYRLALNHRFAYLDAVLAAYRNLGTSISKSRRRRKTALAYMEPKIEQSPGFATLSARDRSCVYFSWGVMNLEHSEPQMAIGRFKSAIRLDPRNFYARSAYWLTSLLGSRAVVFYHLKRKLLGARKLPGS